MSATRTEKVSACLNSTLSALTPAGIMAYLTYTQQQEQTAHPNEGPGKNTSMVGAILDAASGLRFLNSFVTLQAWKHLDRKQLAAVLSLAAVSLAGTTVNALNFGNGNNILCNGSATGTAAMTFDIANSLTSMWMNKAKAQAKQADALLANDNTDNAESEISIKSLS